MLPDTLLNTLQRGPTSALLLLLLSVLVALLLLGWLATALRLRRLSRRVDALTRGGDGSSLEQTLNTALEAVGQADRRADAIEQAVGVLQAQLPGCIQKAHLVRFDAFEDVGGQQSFSIALLDARGDGILLTGVYSRSEARVYAKSVQDGRASHALTQEESRAVQGALG